MQLGINSFYSLLSLDPSIFKVCYDFGQSGSSTLSSIPSGDALYSGALSSVGNFYQQSGRGFFTGQNVRITHETGLFSDNWTMFFVYEKTDSAHGVLFSNYHGTGVVKSGFALGVNDANKFYFETYTDQGPTVMESSLGLGCKNAIAVTKAGNGVYFSLFDFNSRTVEDDTFFVDSSFVLDSTGWYLGDAPNAPSYFSGRAFRGYMDSFCYFNNALMPYQIERLFSGFFSGDADPSVYAFGRDGIAFLYEVNATDFVEVITFPSGTLKTNVNGNGVFSSAYGDFVLPQIVPQAGLNIYVNGLAQVASGYTVSGSIYAPTVMLSGDFLVSGQEIFANQRYSVDDDLIYDVATGMRSYTSAASGTNTLVFFSCDNKHMFINGVKMRSGIDYVPSGAGFHTKILNPTLITMGGTYFSFPIDPLSSLTISGVFNVETGVRFAKGTSQVWRNGLRQALDVNYMEIASIDLLFGSGTYSTKPTLFNNLQLFWQ